MVIHHVRRSTAALMRRYARIAATRCLNDDEKRASELVKTFHASLPEVRWKLILPASLIAVFIVVQVILGTAAKIVTDALKLLGRGGPSADEVRALAESVIRSPVAVPTPGPLMGRLS
jgi:hypothetical protein